jgi:diaminopimelate decarboxylase
MEYAEALIQGVRPTGLRLIIEPGRSLVGNIGVLLTRVISVKKTPERHFVVVDAAMNDLIRPTLYESYHTITSVNATVPNAPTALCDIVGPICESGDFLGKDRQMPLPVAGELLMVRGCGAYGSSMASQYNSRPRAPEILVDGAQFRIIRQRETLESLWANELHGFR